MEEILKVAKEILDLNENASLTGTLMLKLRGIDLDRESNDIDILINDFAINIKFPTDSEVEILSNESYRDSFIRCKYKEFIINIISSNEPFEVMDGWRLGSVEELIKAKIVLNTGLI